MRDHHGKNLQLAEPSTPVEVVGFTSVPMSSDVMNVVSSEKKAREVSALRLSKAQDQEKPAVDSLEDLLNKAQTDSVPKLSLIIKGDVQGTVEAICDSVSKLKSAKVTTAILFKGVGGISESDVNLAQTSNAVILGFNVRASATVVDIAKKSGVAIQYFSIIYEIIDAVKALMKGKLPPITKEVILGHAEVRDAISIPKIGLIAGSMVTDGKITRNSSLRLIRDDVVVHDGKLASLRRFKDDVKEVQSGYECGIDFSNYSNIRVGDIIEAYIMEEIEDKLDI
jgi:translation initiation factor IF-2